MTETVTRRGGDDQDWEAKGSEEMTEQTTRQAEEGLTETDQEQKEIDQNTKGLARSMTNQYYTIVINNINIHNNVLSQLNYSDNEVIYHSINNTACLQQLEDSRTSCNKRRYGQSNQSRVLCIM